MGNRSENDEANATPDSGEIGLPADAEAFLRAFSECRSASQAMCDLDIDDQALVYWCRMVPGFESAFRDIKRYVIAQVLEDRVVDWVVNGVEEPVYQHGTLAGTVTKYPSATEVDRLMSRLEGSKKSDVVGVIPVLSAPGLSEEKVEAIKTQVLGVVSVESADEE